MLGQIPMNSFQKKIGDTPTDALQLVNKKYVDAKTAYGGIVISGGTAGFPFPSGWTVAHTSTGVVTVTHTLGTGLYVAVATPLSASVIYATINNKGSTSFAIDTFNSSAVATDASVFFIVTLA